MLLKLLANLLNLLVPAQTFLVLHLVQPSLFVGGVSGFEASLGVAVDFVGVAAGGEGEGVDGVVDAAGVEGGEFFLRRGRVEAGQVKAFGFFGGSFFVPSRGFRG